MLTANGLSEWQDVFCTSSTSARLSSLSGSSMQVSSVVILLAF